MSEQTKLTLITGTWHALAILCACLLAIVMVSVAVGCTPQGSGQWPPDIAFREATVKGSMELSTPGGPVFIDLSTGMVSGSGEVEVLSSTVVASVGLTINGLDQDVEVQAPGRRGEQGWVQCISAKLGIEVAPGGVLDWTSPLICP